MSCFIGPKLVFISCPLWCCWLLKHLLGFCCFSRFELTGFFLHFKFSVTAGVFWLWQVMLCMRCFLCTFSYKSLLWTWRYGFLTCSGVFVCFVFFAPSSSPSLQPHVLFIVSHVHTKSLVWLPEKKKKTKLLQIQCEITAKPIFSTMPFER